jgi:hypothetical protein
MKPYLGITFREDYKNLPEFKKELERTAPFRKFHDDTERNNELEKAWNYYQKEIGKLKKDELSASTKKSIDVDTSKGKQGDVSGNKKD